MRSFARVVLVAVIATFATACGDDEPGTTGPDPDENEDAATVIASVGLTFAPATVNIITGGLVSWLFQSTAHTVTFTAANGVPANIAASSNTTTSRSFATAGVFTYHCLIHPQMTGTVRVGQ